MFTIKIYHNGEFSKPPERRYKFAVLDYADFVDSNMFSLYELPIMLHELGNGVVIEEIVEDNVVLSSKKDSKLWMIEWCEDEHVDTANHASTSNVFLVVEPTNDENIGYLDYDNEVLMGNPFSFINLLEGSNIEIHNVENEHDIVDGVHESTSGDIHEKLQHASDIHEKVQETLMDDDLFQQDSVVDYQQDPYHVIDY
ncbi:hypothetical protein Tco_0508287 [Tanacetum coccineum]